MRAKKLPIFSQPNARQIVEEVAKQHGTTIRLLENLVDMQREYTGMARKDGINNDLEGLLDDYLEYEKEAELAPE